VTGLATLQPALLGLGWLDPETLLNWMGPFAFWGMLVVLFAECGLFAILPGDSLLFVAGLFVADGWAYAPGIVPTLLAVVAAAWLGNLCGYAVGYRVGPALFKPDARVFKQEYADAAHAFFERYGPRAVIMARFVPIVRTFATLMAGVGRMSKRVYVVYSAVGAVLWGVSLTLAGYWLGQFALIRNHIDVICVLIVLVSLVPMAGHSLRERRLNRRARA
jgi:membrane-associated protein